jgi:protein-S-isoprenylcysteine O-methyltransferase Ste14
MNSNSTPPENQTGKFNRYGVRRLIQVFSSLILFGAVLFLAAGRLDWWPGWVYLGISLMTMLINMLVMWRKNIDLINERGRMAENQKGWDKVLMIFYLPLTFSVLLVGGLDNGRYGWSDVPPFLMVLGGVLIALTYLVITWTMQVNAFLSTVVRIQEERGHQVVTNGPYRAVRHPMYISMIVQWLSTALLLGSWWALIPAGIIGVIFIIRTALEDRMLQEELPGYREYTRQTRFRLVPGIW